MADDELSAPLGRKAKAKPRRFKLPTAYLPHVAAVALGLFVCVCAGWALFVNDPTGGEPVATVATGLGPPKRAMPAVVSVNPAQGPRSYDGPGEAVTIPVPPMQAQLQAQPLAPPPLPATSARNTVTIIDGSTGKRQEVADPRRAGGARAGRAAPARKLPARRDPAHRVGRRPPGRGLRPPRQRRRQQKGRSAHRHRADRARRQRQPDPSGDRAIARAGDVRIPALWRRRRTQRVGRARQGSRDPAAGADGAVRLSRQRSGPADAADLDRDPTRTWIACTG